MSIKLPSVGNGGGLTNGAIVNGIANFYGTTPPANRIDGSPLQDDDIFNEKSKRKWQYRNPFWLSEGFSVAFAFNTNPSSQQQQQVQAGLLFLEDIKLIPNTSLAGTVSSFWRVQLKMATASSIVLSDISHTLTLNNGTYSTVTTFPINTAADHYGSAYPLGAFGGIRFDAISQGSAGTLSATFVLNYRLIRGDL